MDAPPGDGATRAPADARRVALVLGARLCVGERCGGRDRPFAAETASRQAALPAATVLRSRGGARETVETSRASEAAKLCLRFVILTAVRSGEARGATWTEMDPEAREWRIPGERMKGGVAHRVPLSNAALAVLERARALDDGSGLVFPSPLRAGHPLSDMSLTKLLRDRGLADRATVHGFRSAFRDWCADTGISREVAEAALAHTVGGVEGAYFRSGLLERRRALMDAWAAFLEPSA